ncbi:MAG: ShlB/FhaC/HecB family hemolysin secretion/activation protein [Burkholderiales bacterium]|nr:ShlB/FhaC/HecB family hemolysin secretion/activation protein [Burkholderiales bacterium]
MRTPRRRLTRLALGLALAAPVPAAWAQTPPDAGAINQRIEAERRKEAPPKPAVPLALPAPLRAAAGLQLTVKEFRFSGNRLLDTDRLSQALAPFLHRPLGLAQLQEAAAAAAQAYRDAGWVVRAYLAAQDIQDGRVVIQIVEARLGRVRVEGDVRRLDPAQVLALVADQQAAGEPLRAEALERGVLLADDLPGVVAAGLLAAGTADGETDLVVKLADEPLLTGEATLDNTGARSTGAARAGAGLRLNSPARLGDQLGLDLLASEGSRYGRAEYTLPLTATGLRVGANASAMHYKLVGADFAPLDARGSARTLGLSASLPLLRQRQRSVYLALAAERHDFDNRTGGSITSDYRSHTLGLTVYANAFDDWAGGGSSFASASLTTGRVNLDGSPNQAADAVTARTGGHFGKLRWSLARQQRLAGDWSLFAQWSGQRVNRNLDSSEKFFLGGPVGVRAYPANEGGGSEAQLLNLELRWRVRPDLSFSGFHDRGHVRVNHDAGFTGAPQPNGFTLAGTGVSVAWTGPAGLVVKGTLARRSGSNPNANAAGRDQDGSLVKQRAWVVLTLPFAS